MPRRKPTEKTPSPPAAETPPAKGGEFVIGESEFRIGQPEFRIGDPTETALSEFRIGTPEAPTEAPTLRPQLPRGWQHVPIQAPWRNPDALPAPSDDLRRIENPKKRYRGLAALKAYVEPDHVEEIIDMLVYRAHDGQPGPRTISDFVAGAVQVELDRRRQKDGVGERYPDYASQGIKPKRGTRTGRATRSEGPQRESRPVVARLRESLVQEVRDCVIHRNGGQPKGSHTVSQFVQAAIARRLESERVVDGTTARYAPTEPAERQAYLDPRTTRLNR